MEYTEEDVSRIVEALADECILGSLYMRVARRIATSLGNTEELESFSFPLMVMQDAGFAASLSHLARVFDTHGDSVNLLWFLRVVRDNLGAFKHSQSSELLKMVADDEVALKETLRPLLETLKSRRDKYLAHTDRRAVLKLAVGERHNAHQLGIRDHEVLWEAAIDIVRRYYGSLHDVDYHLDEFAEEDELEYLMQVLARNGRSERSPR
jgi:AbiU2